MNNQQGSALLAFVMVLLVVSSYVLLKALNNSSVEREKGTAAALALAKEALIGRAATDNSRPGRLPCPDTNNDGSAESFVGNDCPSYIGRLPWSTLGLPELRDASGEHLWYVLSPSLGNNDLALTINSLTAGELAVGATSQLAAVVLAPEPPLAGQTRPSNNVADYLDGTNADGDLNYTDGTVTNTFNDRLLTISPNEVFRVVGKRVAAEVRGTASGGGLRKYYTDNHEYPWAANDVAGVPSASTSSGFVPHTVLTFSPATLTWLTDNGWFALMTYEVAPDFQAGTSYPQQCAGGCLAVGTYSEAQATLAVLPGTTVAVCSLNPNVPYCP